MHTAADDIEREGGKPTVVTVRARAGVNNADATRFLRSWREAKRAADTTISSLPESLVDQTMRAAALMWAEASQVAGVAHAAIEREWREKSALQEQEISELVERLDAVEREAADAADKHAAAMDAAETTLEAARAENAQALSELQDARHRTAELEKQLGEERASAQATQRAYDALIARLPAVDSE